MSVVFVGRAASDVFGDIVGGGEAGVVQVGEAWVVDGFADPDGQRVAVGIDDDFSGPDAVDLVGGDPAGGEYFGFVVATRKSLAPRGSVVEGRVHVDAVRVIQLVHIANLAEVAVGQPFQLVRASEPGAVPGDRVFRALRQGYEAVVPGLTVVAGDVQPTGVSWFETGPEDLRSPGIHAIQRTSGVEIFVVLAEIPPHRRQALVELCHDDLGGVDRLDRIAQCVVGHGPRQVPGQFIVMAPGSELVGFGARVLAWLRSIGEVVGDHLGEIVLVDNVGCVSSLGCEPGPLADPVPREFEPALLEAADNLVVGHAVLGGIPVHRVLLSEIQLQRHRTRLVRQGRPLRRRACVRAEGTIARPFSGSLRFGPPCCRGELVRAMGRRDRCRVRLPMMTTVGYSRGVGGCRSTIRGRGSGIARINVSPGAVGGVCEVGAAAVRSRGRRLAV
ncbi:hypothetical protein AWN90_18615 [Nocardia terpenica]|uniref:Uncharacterized protein n=1 Tax=Nocardia terpenica TaxID=455432 RepID=A0A0U1Z2N9_9NOCA|nr:hypothetical protein [Nocardia terpenica]KZM75399.1 hypothetical protein AWN90_18615 [Nocardia terpenica]BBE00882.1 hypothetical protein [Nocardia terpenica]